MPSAYCSLYGCTSSRNTPGISLFKVPSGDDEWSKTWREKLNVIVLRDRCDPAIKGIISRREVFICEKHYGEEQMLRHEGNKRKTLKPGSIPYRNMPQKSIPSSSINVKPRQSAVSINAKKSNTHLTKNNNQPTNTYSSFNDFKSRIITLTLPKYSIIFKESHAIISRESEKYNIPLIELYVKNDFSFVIRYLSWMLPSDHMIYAYTRGSLQSITLSHLVKEIESCNFCKGLEKSSIFNNLNVQYHHIPKKFDPFNYDETQLLTEDVFCRAMNCFLLVPGDDICIRCKSITDRARKNETQRLSRQNKTRYVPLKQKAPISKSTTSRVTATLNNYKIENQQLKSQIELLKCSIEKNAVQIDDGLSKDLVSVFSNADNKKISPFMRLFWEEQQKYVSSGRVNQYHPMLIRLCLSLAAKSSSLYEDLRFNEKTGTGFLMLPSLRRLRDYKNYIKPKHGFNSEIVAELCNKVKDFSDKEKIIILALDEMKIQSNLVWCKHSGNLIGFVDLGDDILNAASLPKVDDVASHVLVLLIRSIVNPFKFSFANFATNGISASQLFPIFWKAVGILELKCKLKVLGVTSDGASSNRKFYSMHLHMTRAEEKSNETDVVYRTLNIHNTDGTKRFIYFISDVPHLIKTARNCLAKSAAGSKRYMWNNGKHLLWNHISSLFYNELDSGLHSLPKLTVDHVKLNSYSKMNVKLAAQVLSSSVSKALYRYNQDAAETARFCEYMDSFFDILNIKSPSQEIRDRKPFLKPFTSVHDERFHWLKHVFLGYFHEWLINIEKRQGTFTKQEKNKMFISSQTYKGLKITVFSTIELIKYLLLNDVSYVLTERFSQDPLENYFGRQRSMGSRKDNPTIYDFGYNDNSIRNQKVFRPISTGNSRDVLDNEISDEPVPCRKKQRKK